MENPQQNEKNGVNEDDGHKLSQVIKADNGATIQKVIQAIITGKISGDVIIDDTGQSTANVVELNDYLARAVVVIEASTYQTTAGIAESPADPYKFLYAYDMADAGIFLGRDDASEALLQAVLKDRMTVLHAKSGAGKTSLVNAGLSPRLVKAGRLPIYARAWEEPSLAIKRALAPASFGPWPELLRSLSLQEFLGLACSHLGPGTKEIVVILDQFEDFYIFWPESEGRRRFNDELSDCYNDFNLPVRFVISLRKDYYSDLSELQERIPKIFHNQNRIEPMSREEAYTAITGPTEKLRCPAAYEPALVDKMLDDLSRHGMELPHLQIICSRMYQEMEESDRLLTLESYKALGGSSGLLNGYLHNVLDKLSERKKTLAKGILKSLISSASTKRPQKIAPIASQLKTSQQELKPLLSELIDSRLLRRDESAGKIRYEVAHEYLISHVVQWLGKEDFEFKKVEELLEREVTSCQAHGTLIPKERLLLIKPHWDRLRDYDALDYEMVLRSVVMARLAVEEWSKPDCPLAQEMILKALDTRSGLDGRILTRSLGSIWQSPEISRLGNEDPATRRKAAGALGRIGNTFAVKPLISALKDTENDVRRAAVYALGLIWDLPELCSMVADSEDQIEMAIASLATRGDSRVVQPIVSMLQDKGIGIRRTAIRTLGSIWDMPEIVRLGYEDRMERIKAADALGRLKDAHAVEPLLSTLQDNDISVRQAALRALSAILKIPEIGKLCCNEIDEQIAAIEALAISEDYRSLIIIAAMMMNENVEVRVSAAATLENFGDLASDVLLSTLINDNEYKVKRQASDSLKTIGDGRARSPLVTLLDDEDRDVRLLAASALAGFGGCAVEPLVKALQSDDIGMRMQATQSLGIIGDPRAVEPLIHAYWVGLKMDTASALAKIEDSRALGTLLYDFFCHAAKPKIGDGGADPYAFLVESSYKQLEMFNVPSILVPLLDILRLRDDYCRDDALEYLETIPTEAIKKLGMPEVDVAINIWREEPAEVGIFRMFDSYDLSRRTELINSSTTE